MQDFFHPHYIIIYIYISTIYINYIYNYIYNYTYIYILLQYIYIHKYIHANYILLVDQFLVPTILRWWVFGDITIMSYYRSIYIWRPRRSWWRSWTFWRPLHGAVERWEGLGDNHGEVRQENGWTWVLVSLKLFFLSPKSWMNDKMNHKWATLPSNTIRVHLKVIELHVDM